MWLLGSALAFGAGLLSKEMAVTLPLLLTATAVLEAAMGRAASRAHPGEAGAAEEARRVAPLTALARRLLGMGPHAVIGAVYLAVRLRVLGKLGMGQTIFDRAGLPWEDRLLTMVGVLGDYVRLAFVPVGLTVEYAVNSVGSVAPPALSDPGLWAAAGALAAVVLAVPLFRRRSPEAAFGSAWFLLTLLPVSNLIFGIYVVKAERVLYLPTAGTCLLLGLGYSALQKRSRLLASGISPTEGGSLRMWAPTACKVALVLLVCAYGVGTWLRNPVWKDALSLYSDAVKKQPDSPEALVWLAQTVGSTGDVEEADRLAARLSRFPRYEAAALRLRGFGAFVRGRYEEAAELLARFGALSTDWKAKVYLGKSLQRLGRMVEAGRAFREAYATAPLEPQTGRALGHFLLGLGRLEEALEVLAHVAELEVGSRSDARATAEALARLYEEGGRPDLARLVRERAASPPGGAGGER